MTAATSHFAYPLTTTSAATARRRISPQAGHALEKLGHAIEYLSDEFMVSPDTLSKARLDAILLMMEINREIYSECPEIHSLGQRISSWLRRAA
ncbi:MAG TPA: hypothetical protein VMU71_00305 [Terracidiphilus sp.]|nr:hypothetical protein [Terracidiphilus sp.]